MRLRLAFCQQKEVKFRVNGVHLIAFKDEPILDSRLELADMCINLRCYFRCSPNICDSELFMG